MFKIVFSSPSLVDTFDASFVSVPLQFVWTALFKQYVSEIYIFVHSSFQL